jgi:hypothetical protein
MAAGPSDGPINPGQFTYLVATDLAVGSDRNNR